jgi:hypothetical protein
MAENINIELLIETAGSAKNLGQLKTSLKDLRAAYDQAELGTENFLKLADAVDDTNGKIRSLKQGVDNVKQFTAAAGVLSSTFSITTGVLATFGVENEKVAQALIKVQSALAITQGIVALSEALKAAQVAQLGFNAALLANPFVLVGVAIIGVVAALTLWGNATESEQEKSDALTESLKNQSEAFNDLTNDIKFQSRLKQEISRDERRDIEIQIEEQRKLASESEKEIRRLLTKEEQLKREKASKEDIKKVEDERVKVAKVYTKALEDEQLIQARLKNFDIDQYYDRQRRALDSLKDSYSDLKDELDFGVNLLKALGFEDDEIVAKQLENFDLLLDNIQKQIDAVKNSNLSTDEQIKRIAELERSYRRLNQQKKLFVATTKQEVTIIATNYSNVVKSFSEQYGKFADLFSNKILILQLEEIVENFKNISTETQKITENLDGSKTITAVKELIVGSSDLRLIFSQIGKTIQNNFSKQNFNQIKDFVTTINDDITTTFLNNQKELLKNGNISKKQFKSNLTRLQAELIILNESFKTRLVTAVRATSLSDGDKTILEDNLNKFFKSLNIKFKENVDNSLKIDYEKIFAEIADNIQRIGTLVNQAADIVTEAVAQNSERRIRILENERNQAIAIIDDQLNQQLLSQEEYDAKRLVLEQEYDKKVREEKKKAFIAQKAADIIQATINTALAVTRTLAELGATPLGIGLAAAAGVLGGIQTGLIASQPVPEFAKGGKVNGIGGPTDDSIDAKLSNGESVINARSTSMFEPLLSIMNQLGGGVAFTEQTRIAKLPSDNRANKTQSTSQNLNIDVRISEKEISQVQNKVKKVKNLTTF